MSEQQDGMSKPRYPTEPGLYWVRYHYDVGWTGIGDVRDTLPFFEVWVYWRRSLEVKQSPSPEALVWGPKIEEPPVSLVPMSDAD